MQDLTLDFQNKTISNTFLKGKQLILQKVILSLQCFLGDWFLDGDFGIDYESRLQNKGLFLADIEDVIKSNDGVVSVKNLDIKTTYNGPRKTQKVFNIYATIITQDNEQIELNGLVPIIGS